MHKFAVWESGTKFTIEPVQSHGLTQPIYTIQFSRNEPHATIYRGTSNGDVVGKITLHSTSSKVDVILTQEEFHLTRKDPHASGHSFEWNGGVYSWKAKDLLSSDLKLVDKTSGQTLAKHKKHLGAWQGGSGFELADTIFDKDLLDMIFVTGLGVSMHRKKSDKEWDEAFDEIFT